MIPAQVLAPNIAKLSEVNPQNSDPADGKVPWRRQGALGHRESRVPNLPHHTHVQTPGEGETRGQPQNS